MAKLSETLKERGYVHQFSATKVQEITDGEKRTVYLGIDPSADSLHVGNLMGLLVLRRFLEDGHKIIILTGGGTGMIGDPGGKSEERNLLDEATIAKNTEAVAAQIRRVFGSDRVSSYDRAQSEEVLKSPGRTQEVLRPAGRTYDFIEENNAKWLSKLKLLPFLRDVGKHFTVNAMIKKNTVRNRLKKESPLSFTEFSYSLLQAYDYLHLHEAYGCDVQVGGSDQWSNIIAGVDYIRRKKEKTVYALTWPLLVNEATGKKFGKSEQGAVWLDAKKTSLFDFFQFWVNVEDSMVKECLLKMTLAPRAEIDAVMHMHKRKKSERHPQKMLARLVTALVHGEEAARDIEAVSEALFGGASIESLSDEAREVLMREAPSCPVHEGEPIVDVLVRSTLASSKREARQFLAAKAVSLNGKVLTDAEGSFGARDFHNGIAILKRGKRNVSVLICSSLQANEMKKIYEQQEVR